MLDVYTATLNRTVARGLGHALVGVTYRTYEETTPRSAVASGAGWMHGEVCLMFPDTPHLYLGWGENEGWPDHFSLLPSEISTFREGTLVDISALDAPEWTKLRGQPMRSAVLSGANGTPHVLILEFSTGSVAIGDGHGSEFGDGDEILVRSQPEPQLANFSEVFWRASSAAG